MLINAYGFEKMCKAGIPVIDVFPMTSSYPNKPPDGIHFSMRLFKPVKELLSKYFYYLPANE